MITFYCCVLWCCQLEIALTTCLANIQMKDDPVLKLYPGMRVMLTENKDVIGGTDPRLSRISSHHGWSNSTRWKAKDREVTLGVRKCAFDLCWRSGKLCRAASTLTNEEEGISDMCKLELVALVSMMYETIAECSELLELELVSGVKEKMRLNKEKYDEQECKVSNRILMQNTL